MSPPEGGRSDGRSSGRGGGRTPQRGIPRGPLLAFDTSSPRGSVALARDRTVLARAVLPHQGQHASQLMPAVDGVLARSGVTMGEVQGVVVGEGPGSFTGVRVAAATAQGLARALNLPVWGVPSLAAAALSRSRDRDSSVPGPLLPSTWDPWPIYILFDARADRVYGACYRVKGGLETVVEPHGGTISDILDSPLSRGVRFAGSGAVAHREVLEAAGHSVAEDNEGEPTADGLLRYLALESPAPKEDAGGWEPLYIRDPSIS